MGREYLLKDVQGQLLGLFKTWIHLLIYSQPLAKCLFGIVGVATIDTTKVWRGTGELITLKGKAYKGRKRCHISALE